MEVPKPTKPTRIAISGGGLAGATLINALQKYPHLDVHIYESAPEFSERGAGVGLGINGLNAMREIGPDAFDALDAAGAGSGQNAGTMLGDSADGEPAKVVHRAALLRELLKPISPSVMHVKKKLIKVEEGKGEILLQFSDGSQEHTDLLVGWWDCRSLVPFDKAVKTLGEELFKEHRQYTWIGEGAFMMHDVLDGGETVQCIADVLTGEDWDPDEWKMPLDKKKLEDAFAAWKDGPIAAGMIELLLENPEPLAYAEWDHSNAPRYFKGRVCMAGDSAHAMTPWQGSGASQAIEDVMILAKLLRETKTSSDLGTTLEAYDRVRRPRSQSVVESSRITGLIMCGKGPGIGLDPEKLRSALLSRWKFMYSLDMKEHQDEALRIMKELRSG